MLYRENSSVSQIHHRGQCGRSLDSYKREKLFPHINDQYDFRINNRLLVSKIINPRRDKTIVDSLAHASNKYNVKRKKGEVFVNQFVKKRIIVGKEGKRKQKYRSVAAKDEVCEYMPKHDPFIRKNLKTISAQALEDEEQKEEQCQISEMAKINFDKNSYTRESSLRNNFVGRIIRNIRKENSLFDHSRFIPTNNNTIQCDMAVSRQITTAISKSNRSQLLTRQPQGKLQRVPRQSNHDYRIRNKENSELREGSSISWRGGKEFVQ